MNSRRTLLHSAGRAATSAWPSADRHDDRFIAVPNDLGPAVQATLVPETRRPVALFGHSILGVTAVLAAARVRPAALVLVEPALYDLVRGDAAVEQHIGAVTEARALAATGDLRGFWGILRPLMFGGAFDAARWEDELPVAERWARAPLPWGNGVRDRMVEGIPTLVVTGGWNAEYEAIARRLGAIGAEHVVLAGAQHRPQDLSAFGPVVDHFLDNAVG